MNEIKVKLCGMMKMCDIEYANLAGADYVGFVFADTRRKISYEQAKSFKESLADIPAVGVFVDEEADEVCRLLTEDIIDIAQLHGSEDAAYIEKIRACTAKPIIKAAKVRGREDVENVAGLDVDYLLLDTYRKGILGGTGECFDWDIIKEIRSENHDEPGCILGKKFFLAGGITAENVTEAIKLCPYGLDVSSGIETDGAKDKDKMIEIVRRIRHV